MPSLSSRRKNVIRVRPKRFSMDDAKSKGRDSQAYFRTSKNHGPQIDKVSRENTEAFMRNSVD